MTENYRDGFTVLPVHYYYYAITSTVEAVGL